MNQNYSIVVFPFLKTYGATDLGNLTFRSTQETDDLPEEQANSVKEIAQLLFLKDDLAIDNASYAIAPYIDINIPPDFISHLANIQAVVTYVYSTPHDTLGDPFLTSEHSSMVIFSPSRVFPSLVRPDFNVTPTEDRDELSLDSAGYASGYSGLYNFQHHFWVVPGSHLYGPTPHLTLNISQDLYNDILRFSGHHHHRLLLELLKKPENAFSTRVFTALRWHNNANLEANDDSASLVNLAIAFESLLGLPENNKTDLLVDAIALILGRIPRLNVWAKQFYAARSAIVHEGSTHQLNFVASTTKKTSEGEIYQSLLSYGRQVFRLCLGTLLFGSNLAVSAGLEEKFVTNHERFQTVCRILNDDNNDPCERLSQVQPIVKTINRYRYLQESNLKIQTLIGATCLAAKALMDCDNTLSHEIHEKLSVLVSTDRTQDHLDELKAIQELEEAFKTNVHGVESQYATTIREIVDIVWGYVFTYYYWMRNQHPEESE